MKAWNMPLSLVEISETSTTLTVRQTKAPALRDLRNLLMKMWPLPFTISASLFVYFSDFTLWNHGVGTSSRGWHDPFCLFVIASSSLLLGRLLLRPICSLFGRAKFVFDKGQDVLLRNGKQVGSLREIAAIKPQITKGSQYNPVFRLVLELPHGQKVVVAETHSIPGRGEFRVSRSIVGPTSSFAYLTRWIDYNGQDFVPFLDPEVAEVERRISLFLER